MVVETDNRASDVDGESADTTERLKAGLTAAVGRMRQTAATLMPEVRGEGSGERAGFFSGFARFRRLRDSDSLENVDDPSAKVEETLTGKAATMVRRYLSSSLTRRIVIINATALILLLSGILYLNQFRAGLIDARVQSLLIQGEIIAGAIATSATSDTETITIDPNRLLDLQPGETISPVEDDASLEFPINPERAAPFLRRIISPTKTWARIYDTDGELIVDSRNLAQRGQITTLELPPIEVTETGFFENLQNKIVGWIFASDLPIQEDAGDDAGRSLPEVVAALNGNRVSIVRANEKHELIVSVSVPVQRFRAVLGALVLSTLGGDIDAIVRAERWAIIRMFLVALAVTMLISFVLAGTIAEPMRRLARAAEKIRFGSKGRVEIPDFTRRSDEIGHLSGALRDMTTALYNRIDAIESFAADVAHELKNPLTSLRSAVETLPLARDDNARERLITIVQDDVGRLDRLISDISDASRLDAELARLEAEDVDVRKLLEAVVSIFNETRRWSDPRFVLSTDAASSRADDFMVNGHDSRLGQVIRNLIGNARSFSPMNSEIWLYTRRIGHDVEIRVEDEGPGIRPENLSKIFDRFHTDRPDAEDFGKNSGLGLSISKQIVEAHGGRIWAENRYGDSDRHLPEARRHVRGARFVVRLPVASETKPKSKSKSGSTRAKPDQTPSVRSDVDENKRGFWLGQKIREAISASAGLLKRLRLPTDLKNVFRRK